MIKTEELQLTPKLAKDWLENHNYTDNRPISKTRVLHYARQILSGLWQMNGETIIFDPDGMMLNGQHRCAAVIEAGKSIQVLVVYGIQTSAFTTMDQTNVRTAGQVMEMKGLSYATLRASICKHMWHWETTNGKHAIVGRKVSPDELLLVQEYYPEEVNLAVLWAHTARRELPIGGGLLGLGFILFKRARPRKADEFLQILSDGLTTVKGHPARTFRIRIIKDKMKDKMMPAPAIWSAMIRCWNAYEKGETLKTISISRNAEGIWVTPTIKGLGRKKTGGKL